MESWRAAEKVRTKDCLWAVSWVSKWAEEMGLSSVGELGWQKVKGLAVTLVETSAARKEARTAMLMEAKKAARMEVKSESVWAEALGSMLALDLEFATAKMQEQTSAVCLEHKMELE